MKKVRGLTPLRKILGRSLLLSVVVLLSSTHQEFLHDCTRLVVQYAVMPLGYNTVTVLQETRNTYSYRHEV